MIGTLLFADDASLKLTFEVLPYIDSTFRFRVKEVTPSRERFETPNVVLEEELKKAETEYKRAKDNDQGSTSITVGNNYVTIFSSPFRVEVGSLEDKYPSVIVNSRSLLKWEKARAKGETFDTDKEFDGYGEERFGSHTDKKPYGPSSIGLDFSFMGSKHIYGIPERATSLQLKPTRGGDGDEEPYRMYTLDIFEYALDNNIGLYGVVPLLISHRAERTTGVFWVNSAEMFVDVSVPAEKSSLASVLLGGSKPPQTDVHWFAESGIVDLFFMLGPKPSDIFRQYARITGYPAMPQMFAIAYHQCRWNYRDQPDVAAVDAGFDEHDIPYDVLWLDIEHTDGKRYFTWDKLKFPDPIKMQDDLAAKGRKMVTIVDPHIKRDNNYYIHSQAQSKGYYIKNDGGGDLDGWCWPGSVSYLDFISPEVRSWWADKFAYTEYQGSTKTLYIWNDMNEPTQFNGPEIQLAKDAVHLSGYEHRESHNIYGHHQAMATHEGLLRRNDGADRPFVLTRSFFAGTQRYAAVWTGDNQADFKHLAAASPMLLALSISGITFCGADVGGFFYNPTPELLTRWYQAGAFYPFFRGHAHLDTKRREPWLFGEPYTTYIRNAIQTRYSYLPLYYTLFYQAHTTAAPILRPLWAEYPSDASTYAMDDEFLVGTQLLVKPVVKADQTSTTVYLPGATPWYDVVTSAVHNGGSTITVATPLDFIPVYQRGGTIIPKRERQRRCSAAAQDDPYSLYVALDSKGEAEGQLYIDDGRSFDYQKGAYVYLSFTYRAGVLRSTSLHNTTVSGTPFVPETIVERVVILGVARAPQQAYVNVAGSNQAPLNFEFDSYSKKLTLRRPASPIAKDWAITIL